VAYGLVGLGVLALLGGATWGLVPYGVALGWSAGGPTGIALASAALAAIAMAGAPAAGGLAFACAARAVGTERAGVLYGANSLGSLLGAVSAAVALPWLGMRGALAAYALLAAVAGARVARRAWPALAALALALAIPAWDARLYAVGVYLRISDFADPSPAAVRAFADQGWELLSYEQGATGAVAVGRSTRTGNTWLSINGKVDASTGDDMPTQTLSGQLPVRAATRSVADVLVVGLASGVTAGAALAEPGVRSLTVVELEPAVVRASHAFDAVNGRPLADPRTTLVVDDARGWLAHTDATFDAITSEPSNPWITGVSSLFTLEYWRLLRAHLRPGGAVCQWVQLYGLGTDELRSLIRTFLVVFPDARGYLTVEGSDLLLVGGEVRDDPDAFLDADDLHAAAGAGWLNTDDRPWIEWSAPLWLHYDTGPRNVEWLSDVRASRRAAPPGSPRR
jgi:spermidine synthase